jgi:hypothetical protein
MSNMTKAELRKNRPTSSTGLPLSGNNNQIIEFDPLYHEINLLRIEGFYFCLVPKQTSFDVNERTYCERINTPTGYIEKKIIIDPNPRYGRPGPLAYKILQAILKKYSCYYYPFPDSIPFTQRELARWVGRNSYGGNTQEQFKQAIRQLLLTRISASFYDKSTQSLAEKDIVLLTEVGFSTQYGKLNECVVKLHPCIVNSLNNYHFFCLNQLRIENFPPIATALYKRLFYHFSNIFSQKKDVSFTFRKDYDTICITWLGGLKIHNYKSLILRDQLGYHFKLLKDCRLIKKAQIDKNASGSGFNITFFPGKGFFEDYNRFYDNKGQLQLDFQKATDVASTVKPMQLVCYFYKTLHGLKEFSDMMVCNQGDLDYARELLEVYQYDSLTRLVDYSVKEAKKTNFEMQRFVAVKNYLGGFLANEKKREESENNRKKRLEMEKKKKAAEYLKKKYETFYEAEVDKHMRSMGENEYEKIKALVLGNQSILHQFPNFIDGAIRNHIAKQTSIPSFDEWRKRADVDYR